MKKLTILLMALCVVVSVGCQNELETASPEQLYAMQSITEAGGTRTSDATTVAEFLATIEYQGSYYTSHGNAGYKVKSGKIYYVGAAEASKQDWVEIPYTIAVSDTSIKKLELTKSGVTNIITFDGYGYYSYEAGEGELPTYYSKYDYAENYTGNWTFNSTNSINIGGNGDIYVKYKGVTAYLTVDAQLKGNTLTFKGNVNGSEGINLRGCKLVFKDTISATFHDISGNTVDATKR